jgi:hypothetical protein
MLTFSTDVDAARASQAAAKLMTELPILNTVYQEDNGVFS